MVDVDFEEPEWQVSRFEDEEEEKKSSSRITNLVLKTGLVKDPKQANYVMVGAAIIFLIITIYIFISSRSPSKTQNVPMPVVSGMPK